MKKWLSHAEKALENAEEVHTFDILSEYEAEVITTVCVVNIARTTTFTNGEKHW
jgi:hypothetical protein